MINYELAKELKEAGFPETTEYYGVNPTLSDLIEACGEEFGSLERRVLELGIIQNIIVWDCWGSNPQNQGYGSTPEIAVAKLWLALNKK